MDFNKKKVLISHHWSFDKQRHPIFANDELYLTNSSSSHQRPQVINFPLGASLDMGKLLNEFSRDWYPDLFIAKVDSFFNIVPRNVEALKCPKILILGDTQHGIDPLNRMIAYAKSENYDFYITDHKRHHLWYYWLAGLTNLYWLPGLFLNPPSPGFEQQPFQDPKITSSLFNQKAIFIGQAGKYHPRRQRIIKFAREHIPNFVHGQLPQRDSLKAFAAADISLNISLNGDFNLRNFEILASQGFLLTDRLTDESGIDLLLQAGKEYETYTTLKEMEEKIAYFLHHPNHIEQLRQQGYNRYCNEFTPQRLLALLNQLLEGQTIEDRFTIKSINRIQYCRDTEFSQARISLYQIIQDIHRIWENVEICLDARIQFTSVADFLDLPRVNVTLTNYDDAYVATLKPYLQHSGNSDRIQFVREIQVKQGFNVIITSICDAHLLSRLPSNDVVVISNDYQGLKASSKYAEFSSIISSQEDFEGSFFVLRENNFQFSQSKLDLTSQERLSPMPDILPENHSNSQEVNSTVRLEKKQIERSHLSEQEAFRVCVVHPNKNAYSETFIRAHVEHLPAKIIDLPGVWFPLRYEKAAIERFLSENNIDAILAEFGPAGVAIMEICRELEVPLIVHFHGFDVNDRNVISGEIGRRYGELFEYAAALVVPSQFIQRRLLELGAPAQKIKVNPNGVDTSMFSGAKPALSTPTFLAVSRFIDVKGPHLSILAFKKVIEHCKETRLIMVGDGPLLESCQQITKALGLSDSVQFLGVRQPSEIAALMHCSRAFIQHSIRTSDGQCEAQGIVFLEAGASGLPVVATCSGGIPEVVLNGETGFLVAEGDVDGMAQCMLQLAEDPTLAEQLGKAARKLICTEFTREKSICGLWNIIETAIQEHIETALIHNLNLRDINLIAFPDWSQPEEILFSELETIAKSILKHPHNEKLALLIDTSRILEEDADLIFSSVIMNLLIRENFELTNEPGISLIGKLNDRQWNVLLSRVNYRICLEKENQEVVTQVGAEKLPLLQIDKGTDRMHPKFMGSLKYWQNRYVYGGSSGMGSYGHLAEFKAQIINTFIANNKIETVIELGCGDGNQLKYAKYPEYKGLDISQKAIDICREKFKNDPTKDFFLYNPNNFENYINSFKSDVSLSLDVIFHLVEDDIFSLYMEHLFKLAKMFVVIYSSNYDQVKQEDMHVRHRKFTDYANQNFKGWVLIERIENKYPINNYKEKGSFSEFFIYKRN